VNEGAIEGSQGNGVGVGIAPAVTEVQKEALLAKSQVSLWIDTYDDIFSDFDPRPYAQRALSDDFLAEAKKVVRERTEGTLELNFLVPAAVRDSDHETTIRTRLRGHFRRQAARLWQAKRGLTWQGIALALVGFVLMTAATLLEHQPPALWRTSLTVLLEPAAWFAIWSGFDQVFYGGREIAADHEFYTRMARTEVAFESY
jgi:hypothetical protein